MMLARIVMMVRGMLILLLLLAPLDLVAHGVEAILLNAMSVRLGVLKMKSALPPRLLP